MLTIAEKHRAYKLAHALEVATAITKKAQVDAISVSDALRLGLQIHPLEWWVWELRTLRMFIDDDYTAACKRLDRLSDGHFVSSYDMEDITAACIADVLKSWVEVVNGYEHTYAGEVAFVDQAADESSYVIQTYDLNPDDPLEGIERVVMEL